MSNLGFLSPPKFEITTFTYIKREAMSFVIWFLKSCSIQNVRLLPISFLKSRSFCFLIFKVRKVKQIHNKSRVPGRCGNYVFEVTGAKHCINIKPKKITSFVIWLSQVSLLGAIQKKKQYKSENILWI